MIISEQKEENCLTWCNFYLFLLNWEKCFTFGLIWQQFYKRSIGWEKKAYTQTKNDKNVTNHIKKLYKLATILFGMLSDLTSQNPDILLTCKFESKVTCKISHLPPVWLVFYTLVCKLPLLLTIQWVSGWNFMKFSMYSATVN